MISARDLHFGHVILIGIIFFMMFGVLCFLIDYKFPINLNNKKDNSKIVELIAEKYTDSLVIQNLVLSDEFPYPAEIINPVYNNPKYSKLFEFGASSFYYRTFLIEYELFDNNGNSYGRYYSLIEKRFMILKERPKRILSTYKK